MQCRAKHSPEVADLRIEMFIFSSTASLKKALQAQTLSHGAAIAGVQPGILQIKQVSVDVSG